MHNIDLILTLTGGLAAALAFGYATHRIGLSPIVGYLLAGLAVGPYSPGFVADRHLAEQLAELGVILLMFGVGLHFHLEEMLAVRKIAILGAIGQSAVATILGMIAAWAFGLDLMRGIVFGLAISVASTVVLVRVLTDNRDLHTPTGRIAIGWLVVEDIFTVVVLVLLPTLVKEETVGIIPIAKALGFTALKIGALVFVTLVGGSRLIPVVLSHVAATRSRELFTLTVLVIALGIAVGSAKLFDVSMALGAFMAGMVVGRSEFSLRAASEALPMRDAFAVLFFVSVGMMFEPARVLESPGLVASTLAIVIVGKPLAAFTIVSLRGHPAKVALGVAVALAQIGEFTFLLATLAIQLGVFAENAMNTLVVTAIISIAINPLLYRCVAPLDAWLARTPATAAWFGAHMKHAGTGAGAAEGEGEAGEGDARHRAVVVGYGPVGQAVCRLLRENEIHPAVIELNLGTVQRLKGEGIPAIYGDASHRDTLLQAKIDRAASLILSADLPNAREVIRVARELNPEIRVIARAPFVRDLPALSSAGAQVALSAEVEIALAITEAILTDLGATPEQIERERSRVHAALLAPVVGSGEMH